MHSLPKIPMLLTMWIGVGLVAAVPARADDAGAYFKGPMATCLSRAKIVYPCVSLSPPAYRANSAYVSGAAAGLDLPLDSEVREKNWFYKFKDGAFWNSKWHLSRPLQGAERSFGADRSGEAMHMDLGPMDFNVFVDQERFSESRFFLGIDRAW